MVGFGLSDKVDHDLEIPHYVDHLESLLAAKRLTNVRLYGVSLGALVSVAFAARHPHVMERMVLIAPAGLLTPLAQAAGLSQRHAYDTVDHPGWDRLNRTFDHLVFDAAHKLPDALAVRRAISLQPGMPDSTRRVMSLLNPAGIRRNRIPEEVWRELTAPVLFVECTVDLSFHMIQQARKLVPRCEVISVLRTAHWPHFEDPDTVNPAAIRFLRGLPAGGS